VPRFRGVVSVTVAVVTTGCGSSTTGVCAGPMMEAPHVAVDTAAWMMAHPDASVQACLDGVCEQVMRHPDQPDGTHLYLSGQAVGQPLTVAVRATRGAVTVLNTATTVRLQRLEVGDGGPCGDFSQWVAAVVLDRAGQLHAVSLPRTVTVSVSPGPSSD
jgi:hypothetical protein